MRVDDPRRIACYCSIPVIPAADDSHRFIRLIVAFDEAHSPYLYGILVDGEILRETRRGKQRDRSKRNIAREQAPGRNEIFTDALCPGSAE